jgi:hypothetical protein
MSPLPPDQSQEEHPETPPLTKDDLNKDALKEILVQGKNDQDQSNGNEAAGDGGDVAIVDGGGGLSVVSASIGHSRPSAKRPAISPLRLNLAVVWIGFNRVTYLWPSRPK